MIYDIQKASLLKRFSAFLLDLILLCTVAVGFAFLLSWALGVNGYTETIKKYRTEYEEKYNVQFNISQADYDKLTQAEKDVYQQAYSAMFKENPDFVKAYNMSIALPILITTISLLLAFLGMEFGVPLLLKNGQTVGKKVFSLGVVFTNSVRLNTFALFVRSILGKYTIGTMFPVMLVMLVIYGKMGILGLILAGLILVLQIVVLCVTKTRSFIHDLLANTVVVDLQSQMIFDTTQELVSYKEELHKQVAEKKEY